jgi:uroporphyrinogen-III synthase
MTATLTGKVVLVTRPQEDAGELAGMLEARGARALVAPAIERIAISDGTLDHAVRGLADGAFAWVVFTSRAAVEAVFDRLGPSTGRTLPVRVAAIGAGTAEALRRRAVDPEVVPPTFTTAALGRALPKGSGNVLLPRADIAPDALDETVAAKGWTPIRVDAYQTRPARSLPPGTRRALERGRVDVITFTSASTVEGFLSAADGVLVSSKVFPPAVCIGPVTAAAARKAGLPVAGVARPHTIEGLVDTVERVIRRAAR